MAGFGYPIYGSDLPQSMKRFIEKLEPVQKKAAFVFCTQWQWSGDGARNGASFLKPKGYQVLWGEHFKMPNNVTISLLPLPYTNDQVKLKNILSQTSLRIQHFVNCILKGRSLRRGFNPVSCLLGSLQRVPFRLVFKKLQNDMGIDPLSCTKCGECACLCPSGNLVFDRDNFSTRARCILCLRCYNFCPNEAITYRNRPHNKRRGKPYKGPVEGFYPGLLKEYVSLSKLPGDNNL